jgi:hypothetical protein
MRKNIFAVNLALFFLVGAPILSDAQTAPVTAFTLEVEGSPQLRSMTAHLMPLRPGETLGEIPQELRVRIGEQDFYRVFTADASAPDSADPVRWTAWPTSFAKSFFVSGSDGSRFIVKTALNYQLNYPLPGGGWDIDFERAARAVQVDAYYRDMAEQTSHRIPNTNKSWTYFSEPFAGRQPSGGWMIWRGLPADMDTIDSIPMASLFESASDGSSLRIEELYQKSGGTDRFSFVWDEIVKPVLEFEAMVDFKYGMRTELHGRNLLLRLDTRTKRIVGVSVRDLDVHSIDYLGRRQRGLPVPEGDLTVETSALFGYFDAVQNRALGFEFLKSSVLKKFSRSFLNDAEMERLIGATNALIVKRFNENYGTNARDVSELSRAYRHKFAKASTDLARIDGLKPAARWRDHLTNSTLSWLYRLQGKFEKSGFSSPSCSGVFRR